jgi:hypothetical protein
MINSGLTLDHTFSKRLESYLPGVSVRNLAISGQGPFQYVQVLQTYGLKRRPRFAIFCFNEGNDIQDIGKYLRWKSGSSTDFSGGYESGITDPFLSLTAAFSQTLKYLQHQIWLFAETALFKTLGHDAYFHSLSEYLATVQLPPGQKFRIAFIDLQNTSSSKEIRRTEDWKELKALLVKFRALCAEHRIVPVILFVPTAAHIYAEYTTIQSGRHWLKSRDRQIEAKANLEESISQLSKELGISYVSLTTVFEVAAKSGIQVFDSFSVHMTPWGTELSGAYVACALQQAIVDPDNTSGYLRRVDSRLRQFSINSIR